MTYVCCCQDSDDNTSNNIVLMTEFALALMTSLDRFNQNSFNVFKLRIGNFTLYTLHIIRVTLGVVALTCDVTIENATGWLRSSGGIKERWFLSAQVRHL